MHWFLAKRVWASQAVLGDLKPQGTEVSLLIQLLMPVLCLGGVNDARYIQGVVCAAVFRGSQQRAVKKGIAFAVQFSSSSLETILYPERMAYSADWVGQQADLYGLYSTVQGVSLAWYTLINSETGNRGKSLSLLIFSGSSQSLCLKPLTDSGRHLLAVIYSTFSNRNGKFLV